MKSTLGRKRYVLGLIAAGLLVLNGAGMIFAEETGSSEPSEGAAVVQEEAYSGLSGETADVPAPAAAEDTAEVFVQETGAADGAAAEPVYEPVYSEEPAEAQGDCGAEETVIPDGSAVEEVLTDTSDDAERSDVTGTANAAASGEESVTAGDDETDPAEAAEAVEAAETAEAEAEDSGETAGSGEAVQEEAAEKEQIWTTAADKAMLSAEYSEADEAVAEQTDAKEAGLNEGILYKPPTNPECSMLLSNGVYNIFTMLEQSLALTGGSTGASATINTKTADKTQRFKLTYDALNKAYSIINEASGLALSAASIKSVETVTTAAADGSARQRWVIVDNGDGTFSLVSQYNSRALNVANNNGSAGEKVLTKTASGITAQKWLLDLVGSSARLSDGVYEITLKSDPTLAAGTNGQSMTNNVGINLQKAEDTDGQKFVFIYTANGTYSINNYNSGKAMSSSGSSIVQKSADGSPQYWILSGAGNGSFYFINAATGKALTAGGTSVSGGKYLGTGTPSLSSAQQFVITKKSTSGIANGQYSFGVKKNPSLVISTGGSTASGAVMKTAVSGQSYSEADTQNYTVKSIGNGYYQITNSKSGLALAVNNGSIADGTAVVQLTPASGHMNQMWLIHKENDGSVSFINAATGKMAMISSASSGSKIIQKDFDNTASSLFKLQAPLSGPVCDMVLSNGIYTIASRLGNSMMLSVAGGSASSGANVRINSADGSKAQRFRLTYDWATRSYTIINENSGKAVSPAGTSLSNGVNVDQETANNSILQHWVLRSAGGGSYQIVNQWSGKVLDVSGSNASDGTNVTAYASGGGTNQKWGLKLVGSSARFRDGIYEVSFAQNPALCVGTQNSLMTNDANIQLQTDQDTDNQRFILSYLADGTYLVNNYNSGRTMSAETAKSGANVLQHSNVSGDNQHWILSGSGTGSFYLVNATTGKVLGAASSAAVNGTNLIASDLSGAKSQQFGLTYYPAPAADEGTFMIISAESTNWAMHVTDGSRKLNAHVELSKVSSTDANSQKFTLTSTGDGYYTISNVKSKHSLGVFAGYADNGFNLHQERTSKGGNLIQKWLVHHNSNGTVSFINAKTGKTAMSQSTTQTKDMIQSDFSYTANRQFKLMAASGTDTEATDWSYEPKAYEDTMIMYANWFDSKTDYQIVVDRDHFRLKVYKGSKGKWREVKSWICSVGELSYPTTPGEQFITGKALFFDSGYMRLYYANSLSSGRLIHSIGYYAQDYHTPEDPGPVYDGTLGGRVSHGCVRVAIENAKWVYDNCPINTKVYIF